MDANFGEQPSCRVVDVVEDRRARRSRNDQPEVRISVRSIAPLMPVASMTLAVRTRAKSGRADHSEIKVRVSGSIA